MTSRTIVSKRRLAADLRNVIDDTEELLKATAGQAGERVNTLRARAEKSLLAAKDRVVELEQAAVQKVHDAAKATDAYVHQNPWPLIGAAAGIGFVLGWFCCRRD